MATRTKPKPGPLAQELLHDILDELRILAQQHRRAGKLLLTVDEAADILSLSRTRLYEIIAREEIRVVRSGRAVRVPASELERWVEEQLTQAGGGPWPADDAGTTRGASIRPRTPRGGSDGAAI